MIRQIASYDTTKPKVEKEKENKKDLSCNLAQQMSHMCLLMTCWRNSLNRLVNAMETVKAVWIAFTSNTSGTNDKNTVTGTAQRDVSLWSAPGIHTFNNSKSLKRPL
jgi:hypothetical protein